MAKGKSAANKAESSSESFLDSLETDETAEAEKVEVSDHDAHVKGPDVMLKALNCVHYGDNQVAMPPDLFSVSGTDGHGDSKPTTAMQEADRLVALGFAIGI